MDCYSVELEPGYFEFRLTWSGSDLLAMEGHQLDALKAILAKASALVAECDEADKQARANESMRLATIHAAAFDEGLAAKGGKR